MTIVSVLDSFCDCCCDSCLCRSSCEANDAVVTVDVGVNLDRSGSRRGPNGLNGLPDLSFCRLDIDDKLDNWVCVICGPLKPMPRALYA